MTEPSPPAQPAQPATTAVAAKPVIPDYLKAFVNQQSADSDSMASASTSIPRVSLRGKKFRFLEGGEEIFTQNDNVDVVILGVTPEAGLFVKTYYAAGYTGQADTSPPTCASDDGRRPSPWITEPQSQNCATCEKNRFGSAKSRAGKPAKACRDSKRLWVALPSNIEGTVYALQVPVTSLKELAEYGREFKSMGNVPIASAITTIHMDDDSEFPMLSFKCAGFLPEDQGKIAMERNESKTWMLMQVTGSPALGAPPQQQALPAASEAPAGTVASAPAGSTPETVNDALKNW